MPGFVPPVVLADYSEVDAAIAAANELNEELYSVSSWANLQDAINAVTRDLTINYQDRVDGYAAAIWAAIDALVEREVTGIIIAPDLSDIAANPQYFLVADGRDTWILSFYIERVFDNGTSVLEKITVEIHGNNITNNFNIGSHSFYLGDGFTLELRFQGSFNSNNSYIRIVS